MAGRSGRDADYFWAYLYWQYGFDALSAACGAGLRVGTAQDAYTESGRWLLTLVGVCGALLYMLMTWHALAQAGPSLTIWRAPGPGLVAGMFAGWQAVRHIRRLEPGITTGQSRGVSLGWGCGAIVAAVAMIIVVGILFNVAGL